MNLVIWTRAAEERNDRTRPSRVRPDAPRKQPPNVLPLFLSLIIFMVAYTYYPLVCLVPPQRILTEHAQLQTKLANIQMSMPDVKSWLPSPQITSQNEKYRKDYKRAMDIARRVRKSESD
jgi:hypothetical protein